MTQLKLLPTLPSGETNHDSFRIFLSIFLVVVLALPAVLWLFEEFSLRTYFTLCFIWLLITSEVFAPADPDSVWWHRIQWVKLVGWVVFLAIVTERILLVLG